MLNRLQVLYICSAPLLLIFTSIIHPGLTKAGYLNESAQFLPLMMTSVWCSIGMWMAWLRLGMAIWRTPVRVEVKLE